MKPNIQQPQDYFIPVTINLWSWQGAGYYAVWVLKFKREIEIIPVDHESSDTHAVMYLENESDINTYDVIQTVNDFWKVKYDNHNLE